MIEHINEYLKVLKLKEINLIVCYMVKRHAEKRIASGHFLNTVFWLHIPCKIYAQDNKNYKEILMFI